MTAKDGMFDGQELWFRCFHCGDSNRHPSKAHCSVNVFTSLYYCLRCGSSGKLSSYETGILTQGLAFDRSQMEIDDAYQPDAIMDAIRDRMRPGQGTERYSAADRWHIKTELGSKLDLFKLTDVSQDLVGYHVRPPDKAQTRTYGKRLFIIPSTIRYNRPWRLVEGPYDLIDPQSDIACLGFPSEMQARALAGKKLILCPDGDVWQDYRKLRSFMKPLLWNTEVMIESIERLPPDTDPDMQMPSKREKLEPEVVREMLSPKKSFFTEWMKPEQILDDIRANRTEEEFWGQYV